jgi:hypothetical protein
MKRKGIICNIIVIPNKKPRFQKEFIWRGQGYDCKWDFISNTKYNWKFFKRLIPVSLELSIRNGKRSAGVPVT